MGVSSSMWLLQQGGACLRCNGPLQCAVCSGLAMSEVLATPRAAPERACGPDHPTDCNGENMGWGDLCPASGSMQAWGTNALLLPWLKMGRINQHMEQRTLKSAH